jgi:predicted ATP-dependent endonuclease of OLD family
MERENIWSTIRLHNKKTQNQILKYFLIDRPYELVFLVEGDTEEAVIELILKARALDLEKDGFFVYNIQGQNNLEHLKPLFRISHLIDITIVAMLDRDIDVDKKIEKMKEHARQLGYTKDLLIRLWNRDFETENFGLDAVIEKANELIDKKGYNKVSKSEVEARMNVTGDALIRAIENTIRRTNLDKLGNGEKVSDIISKPRLAKQLISERLKQIRITDDPDWNAKLPIEVELKKSIRTNP